MGIGDLWDALRRCKPQGADENATKLSRCLNLLDLTALGVGSTLGLGVYILAGSVAKTVAGPAVCISFLVAAIASAFAGVCYAEFAARVPKAGSAYVYSYVSVGEFVAFSIGWNLILEYVIGTASVAKGMSGYIDSLCNNTIQNTLRSFAPIDVAFLSTYPDFFALAFVLLIAVLLAVGVKESSKMNNAFTLLNMITVVTVVIAGAIKSDPANWRIKPEDIPEEYRSAAGTGGFMPFGIAGVMAGAAKCFYGFVGFDCVATTGEEAKNPQRNIPLSIVISLIVIFASYFSVSTVLTMMYPYYLQNADAPFPTAFQAVGMPVIMWIVTIGAIFALCTSLLGAMFPLPRVLYAMASDGVLFRSLSTIHPKTMTPLFATAVSGILSGAMATIFDLEQLIEMMSIGTLLAYTIVAVSVLILRYEVESPGLYMVEDPALIKKNSKINTVVELFNLHGNKHPNNLTSVISKCCICLFMAVSLVVSVAVVWTDVQGTGSIFPSVFGAILVLLLVVLYRQPQQDITKLTFKVPLVPLLPYLSVLMNLYLMVQLDKQTWIRFGVWIFVGYLIYFFYGVKHSSLSEYTKKSLSQASTASVITEKDLRNTIEINDKSLTKF